MPTDLPILDFTLTNDKHFNARATRDAVVAYWRHVVAPLVLRALLECKANPGAAEARIAAAGL